MSKPIRILDGISAEIAVNEDLYPIVPKAVDAAMAAARTSSVLITAVRFCGGRGLVVVVAIPDEPVGTFLYQGDADFGTEIWQGLTALRDRVRERTAIACAKAGGRAYRVIGPGRLLLQINEHAPPDAPQKA